MKPTSIHSLSSSIASVLLVFFGIGCEQKNAFVPPPPPEVTVAKPSELPFQAYFRAPGQTRTTKRVELRARVSGYLKEVLFNDGDRVEAKQPLFVIDQAPFKVAVLSAQADLDKAQAQLRLKDQQLVRTKNLAERQATTESALETAEAERNTAYAEAQAAKAALDEANLNLNYTTIEAPFSGKIGRHLIEVGNLVQTNETLLAVLEADEEIHAYFTINESDLLRFMQTVAPNSLISEGNEPIPVELALGDSDQFDFQGTLDFREFGVDPTTGTTKRRAVFKNQDGRLLPGLFINARVRVGDLQNKLFVEEVAISTDQRGQYVWIVNKDNKVERRAVELGQTKGSLRVIEKGITSQDRVIIRGMQKARPDIVVVPKEQTMGAEDKPVAAPEPAAPPKLPPSTLKPTS